MKKSDISESHLIAMILEKVSYLVGVLFFTVPLLIMMVSLGEISYLLKIFIFASFWFALIFIIRSWHVYIDAQFFSMLAKEEISLKELDTYLVRVFHKKELQGLSLEERITRSVSLMKRVFLLLVLHIICFIIPLFASLINYANIPTL